MINADQITAARIRGFRLLPLALASVLFTARLLSAHETWLEPSCFSGRVGETIEFDLTSGMGFPALEYAIKGKRVALARYRLDGKESALARSAAGKESLRFQQAFSSPGVVTAWVALAPKDIVLTDEKVVEYFEEIDPSPAVREAWTQLKGHQKWKEIYTKFAKTCVVIGEVKGDPAARLPVGMDFEIVPQADPGALRAGEPATFQLLAHGQPLAHASIGLLAEGQRRVFQTTDAEGRATFPLAHAGRTLVFAVDLHLAKDRSHWESKFTTFTFAAH